MSESTPVSSDRYDVYVEFTSNMIYWRDKQEFFLLSARLDTVMASGSDGEDTLR